MRFILSWIFTIPFFVFFFLILFVFHPIQVIALKLGGYSAHKKVVDWMCFCLVQNLHWTLSRVSLKNLAGDLPTDRPLIIVSNHQSAMDIPMIAWVFRKNHPKYISKESNGKGIPSISYNIRNGGSVLIDREKPKEALQKIQKFAEKLGEKNYAACIFPEGTRTKDGNLHEFKSRGIAQLLDSMPNALIVPVAIQDNWKIESKKFMPIPVFNHFRCTALQPIEPSKHEKEELAGLIRSQIEEFLDNSVSQNTLSSK
jgi:1-acyl-sn-glycerol-3-phosphate acyltransferase